MADDNAKLLIVLEAQSKKLQNQLVDATRTIDRFAAQTNRRFDSMNAKNAASFERLNASVTRSMGGLNSAIAPLLGALGTREIIGYADAWTEAGNKIAAAGQVAGREGRSLEALNVIANDTRTSIAATTDLYAKLLRSTKDVAKSELEVAQATAIVNKAFKAGGAATSEQIAGILQLSQGLGSGILQGDELRSLRENAPLLAQAIADEFGTTIAGLKELGAEGKLTSDRVFKAILGAQSGIEAAFNATNATIGDSFTKVNNALTQYIGTSDQTKGAAYALQAGLTALADNFENIADVTLKVAAVIAAAMVGRAIGGMIVALGTAGAAVAKFVTIARTAQGVGGLLTAIGGIGAVANPVAAVVGTVAAGAIGYFAAQAVEASQRTDRFNETLERLGIVAKESATQIDAAAAAQTRLSTAEGLADATQEADDAKIKLAEFEAELEKLAVVFRVGAQDADSQVAAISRLVDGYLAGTTSAEDLNDELDRLATNNPDWAADLASIQAWAAKIEQARLAVSGLADEMSRVSEIGVSPGWAEMLNFRRGPQVTTDLGEFPEFNKPPTFGSLSEFNRSGTKPTKGGGKKSPADTFKEALEAQREENRLLAEKTALQATLNPLIEDYGFAVEKLNVQQELQTAATAAGLELTPALKASIDELATGYANASVEAARLAESQDQLKQISDDFNDAGKSAIKGFISDLREGKSAADALSNAMNAVLDKVIDIGLNMLLGGFGGGSGGLFGGIGRLFGFAGGGYTGNGGRNEPAGVVHKGEYVFTKAQTARLGVGNLAALARGYANGGYVGAPGPVSPTGGGGELRITVGVDVDSSGNLVPFVTEVADSRVAKAAPAIGGAAVRTSSKQAGPAASEYNARFGTG